MLLESSGLADTLVSPVESKQTKIASETATYPSAQGVKAGGYLSAPPGEGRFPAVVVIHENRGLNEHTRDVARRFAAEGFVALAPDALLRKGGTAAMESPDKAREAMSLPAEDAITDLKAGLAFFERASEGASRKARLRRLLLGRGALVHAGSGKRHPARRRCLLWQRAAAGKTGAGALPGAGALRRNR